ncbi:Hypothetical predicted protein [Cloeon dipterum]|uniref:Uncharacterized protein n=1 Tax=Cloeon dipterum TaxID=197152 RepID=A0A8S1EBK2_9INSE|nr:Hypothetical predicted protein [Cloeon dipterum]
MVNFKKAASNLKEIFKINPLPPSPLSGDFALDAGSEKQTVASPEPSIISPAPLLRHPRRPSFALPHSPVRKATLATKYLRDTTKTTGRNTPIAWFPWMK